MTDMNIALILRLVDRATGPARDALQNVERVSNRIGESGLKTLEMADRMDEASRVRRQNLALETAAVSGMVYGIYSALQPAIQFEAAMAKVGAVSRATDGDLARLAATAQELGASTPWAAREAAEGMQYLAMAGFDVNEVIAAMPGLLDLASAGATDLGATSDIASNILSGFKLEAARMGEVGDILTNTFTTSNTDLAMLGATMEQVAPVAADFGIDLATVAGMAGKLGDAGMQGEKSGTALRAILARLAAPSNEAAKALKALNVEVADADGNLRPLPDILAEMATKTEDMGTAARGDLLSTVFGIEALSAASILLDQAGSGSLQSYIATLGEVGSAARVADRINANTAGSIKQFQSAAEALSIALGTALLPALTDLIERITPIVQAGAEWAGQNPELISQIAGLAAVLLGAKIGLLALRIAFEPVIAIATFAVRAFGWLQIAIGLVGRAFVVMGRLAMTNPIIAILTLIAAAAYVIYQNWDQITAYISAKIDRIKAAFDDGLLNGVLRTLSEFNPFLMILDGAIGLINYLTGWDLSTVTEMLTSAFDIDLMKAGIDMITSLSSGIWSVLTGLVEGIRAKLAAIVPQWMIDGIALVKGGGDDQFVSFTPDANTFDRRTKDYPFSPQFTQADLMAPGGNRALGGPVRRGGIYRVNERGEELFAPGQSGSIITARDARRGGSSRTSSVTFGDIVINAAPGMDPQAIARAVRRELKAAMDRSGALDDRGLV